MAKKKQNKQDRLTYKHFDNAICLTMHTQNGSELPPEAQDEAALAVMNIALKYGCLINIANT